MKYLLLFIAFIVSLVTYGQTLFYAPEYSYIGLNREEVIKAMESKHPQWQFEEEHVYKEMTTLLYIGSPFSSEKEITLRYLISPDSFKCYGYVVTYSNTLSQPFTSSRLITMLNTYFKRLDQFNWEDGGRKVIYRLKYIENGFEITVFDNS